MMTSKLSEAQRRAFDALGMDWTLLSDWKEKGGHRNPAYRGGFQKVVDNLAARGLIEYRWSWLIHEDEYRRRLATPPEERK